MSSRDPRELKSELEKNRVLRRVRAAWGVTSRSERNCRRTAGDPHRHRHESEQDPPAQYRTCRYPDLGGINRNTARFRLGGWSWNRRTVSQQLHSDRRRRVGSLDSVCSDDLHSVGTGCWREFREPHETAQLRFPIAGNRGAPDTELHHADQFQPEYKRPQHPTDSDNDTTDRLGYRCVRTGAVRSWIADQSNS